MMKYFFLRTLPEFVFGPKVIKQSTVNAYYRRKAVADTSYSLKSSLRFLIVVVVALYVIGW